MLLRKIRHLNIIVIVMLLLQVTVYPVSTLGSEKASITAEQAVKIVKDNFTIPEKYSQLFTGYNEYNKRATYSLNWNSAEPPGGSFHAEVDATNGDILNVGQWQQPTQPSIKLPLLSASDAEKKATALITKLAQKHLAEMQLVKNDQQVLSLNNAQPFTYNYRWIRVVNDIPFPNNGVNISVSGQDGQIINYNYNWTEDLTFPKASAVISPEQARQVFNETPMLELQYYLTPIMDPQASEKQRVLLVYQLANDFQGGAIDALSGKPVTIDPQGISYSASASASASTSTVPAKTSSAPAEESASGKDSQDNSQQISQTEAVNIVKKIIKIPSNLVLQGCSLNPDWQNPSEQIWNLQWNTDPFKTSGQQFLSARVNAQTGDFVGFNQSSEVNPTANSKPISRKDAQKIAEDFLKLIQSKRFPLVKLRSDNFGGKMPANIQMFNYVRLENGIPVSNNGMNIVIDTVAKKVSNYDLNWSNSEFPSSSGVLPLDKVTERFLQIRPLTLNYTLLYLPNDQLEVRLVYQPNTDNSQYMPSMLDAKTGDLMDVFGKSQPQWSGSHTFTDIQGNYAEKEISIIGLTGAFGEYGQSFHPDEKITTSTLLRAMLTAEGNNRNRVLNDEDVAKMAKERGWLKEDVKLESELSRADLCKIMIRYLGMEPAAKAQGIYAVPFKDANTLQPDSLGYVALAWGLGILKVDGDTLQPTQTVTRADAAYALVHAYAVDRPTNPYMR
ncbi:hypothetical protein DSBG_2941 [Desulfosporosinus sp. BG]|nr:hypothetical protein DSBG_2941 [Desulfosporosinus sp. BG]